MADPLRRTLLAKLRGRRSKKPGPSGGGGGRSQAGKEQPREPERRRRQEEEEEAGPAWAQARAQQHLLSPAGGRGAPGPGARGRRRGSQEEVAVGECGLRSADGAGQEATGMEPGPGALEAAAAAAEKEEEEEEKKKELMDKCPIPSRCLVPAAPTQCPRPGTAEQTDPDLSRSFSLSRTARRQDSLDSEEKLEPQQQQQQPEEEEEEDYYDNEKLQGYEPELEPAPDPGGFRLSRAEEGHTVLEKLLPAQQRDSESRAREGSLVSAQERDRLRSQLQEAYYLLIHAMHDMPVASTANLVGYGDRVWSCRSQDSVCASVRLVDGDGWSSDEAGPPQRQQVSDVPSSSPASCLSARREFAGESLGNLVSAVVRQRLQRSVSDGVVNYAHVVCPHRSGFKVGHSDYRASCHSCADLTIERPASRGSQGSQSPLFNVSGRINDAIEPSESSLVLTDGTKCNAGLEMLGSRCREAADADCGLCEAPDELTDSQGCSFKPPAVTVNKMQEWMTRGRLLSLEMKERISGSHRVSVPPSSLAGQAAIKEVEGKKTASPASVRVQGNKTVALPTSQRVLLTDFIENVHISSIIKRELKTSEVNEVNEPMPHVNNITVSKKRNWLQQSTHSPYWTEETNVLLSVELTNHMNGPGCLSQERKRQPLVPPREPVGQNITKQIEVVTLYHSDENDADDEGEIWYNPIPEDDEADLSQIPPPTPGITAENVSSRSQVTQPTLPSINGMKGPVNLGTSTSCFEGTRESQVAPATDVNQGNPAHSTDRVQLPWQMCACKSPSGAIVEEGSVHKSAAGATTDPSNGPDCSVVTVATTTPEFSPSSSPSPLKKGSAINWSFPEKIKSPRTVRKLSMKMKKLPELSRKLSVKGTASHNNNDNHNSSPKASHGSSLSGNSTNAASRNVISRYHLDTSVVSQNDKKKSTGNSKSASKGGYLSDGDSPELVAKAGKHSCDSKSGKGNTTTTTHKTYSTEIDIDAFRHYSFVDQPKCSQYISGLMSVHFYGAEDLKPPRIDSRDVFCAIQVDSVNKARTALLTCRTTFLDMDHTFNIELENAQHLKLVVFSWEPTPRRNRVCCHGTVVLPTLFRVAKMHQLAVKLEPRGLIYVKLTLMEQWENSLDSPDGDREPVVFGVEARKIVEKENVGLRVPLLMQKCIVEIEKRGCQVVGLYRLCGSAAVKKELREAFERDSKAVGISENLYPDINVITGVLKDYLRELPSPLITKQLYETVLEAMAKQPLKMTSSGCENDLADSEYTVALLDCLPEVEKATLKMLLDHLKRVASYHEVNKMTCQNLAVCFGPVLLSQRQEASNHSNRVFIDSEELASALDFKKHIEVLHYLLQLWPVQKIGTKEQMETSALPEHQSLNCVRRRKQRPTNLNLTNAEVTGVLRPRQVRLDSPSNRYAGDWSSCDGSFLLGTKESSVEADYDDVPSEGSESEEENGATDGTNDLADQHTEPESKEHTYEAYVRMQKINPGLEHTVNLQDLQESIDTLIGNLERELNKNKLKATC